MALTGKLLADFDSFFQATNRAEAELRTMEAGAGKVERSLNQMVEPTTTLSGRMVALGAAVGTFIGALAANAIQQGVSSLIDLGKEAFTSASAIVDMSNKTGLSTEAIQRMSFVASQTGGSLEGFTRAAFQLGARLSGDSKSVRQAVDDLGLSFSSLRNARPEAQFDAVVAALERMENPQERNRLGIALMGKTFEQIAPAIAEGYSKMASEATFSSDAQIKALDRMGDAWDAFKSRQLTAVRSWLGGLVVANENWSKFTEDQKARYNDLLTSGQSVEAGQYLMNRQFQDIALAAEPATKALQSYADQLASAKAKVAELTPEEYKEIEAAKALGISAQDLSDKMGISTAVIGLATDAQRKLKEETEKAAKAYQSLISEAMNAEGLAQMNEAAATIARAAKNAEGIWLMERDAWQLAFAERQKAAAQEQAATEARDKEWNDFFQSMGNGLAIIGQVGPATEGAASQGTAALDRMTQSAIQLGTQLKLAVPPGFSFEQAYRDAGLFVHESPALMRGNLNTQSGFAGNNVNVTFNDAFLDTPAGAQRTASRLGNAVLSTISGQGRPIG